MNRSVESRLAKWVATCAIFAVFGTGVVYPAEQAVAQSTEAVVMPFHCSWKSGEPVLTPSLPTAYEILGARHQRPYTACRDAVGRSCATVMLHQFSVPCGERDVSWHRLAPLLRDQSSGRSWMEHGVLNLVSPSGSRGPGGGAYLRMALPAQFAPIGEVGARLAFSSVALAALEERSSADPQSHAFAFTDDEAGLAEGVLEPGPASPESWSTQVSTLVADVSDGPSFAAEPATTAQRETAEASFDPVALIAIVLLMSVAIGAVAGFATWRRLSISRSCATAPHDRAAFGAQDPRTDPRAGLFASNSLWVRGPRWAVGFISAVFRSKAVGSVATGLGHGLAAIWFALTWAVLGPFRADGRPRGAQSAAQDRAPAGGFEILDKVFEQTAEQVGRLGRGHALHETLQAELKSVRKRFNVNRLLAQEDEPDREGFARRQSILIRTAIRDLERISKIARSAEVSLKAKGGARGSDASATAFEMPQTVAEAYQVFGVSDSVSDQALKRVVDGLRMSWHPDLAQDDEDRSTREERIKQINLAWDLIKAQRREDVGARTAA